MAVEALANVVVKFLQMAYASFTFCLQNEWQYLQRVVADVGPFFEPLECAIQGKFIPALIGLQSWEITGKYRLLLTHSISKGGLAIRNLVDTAAYVHLASKQATLHLTESLVGPAVGFDLGQHLIMAQSAAPPVFKCGRTLLHLSIQWMALLVVRQGMQRRDW